MPAKPKVKKSRKLSTPRAKTDFPIVAIGASAGGLEAVSSLLKNLPLDTGMAFIYVQHLSPDHPSDLSAILTESTKMPVQEVKHLLKVEPGKVYICAPNKEITISGGKIKLSPRQTEKLPYLPIDYFFTSLAKQYGKRVIGIVLSGNAADGTNGLKAIREAGGTTFAQDRSAKYDSMPRSAIDEQVVDFVASPKGIAAYLVEFGKPGFEKKKLDPTEQIVPDDNPDLRNILLLLHKERGVDFSHYKMSTIKRRLNHRALHLGESTLKQYYKLLTRKGKEIDLLYKDLLINVTSFFREAATYSYLKTTFLPKLLRSKAAEDGIRIWVPACSTGEEAYSLAMLITELQDTKSKKHKVQIFATDLSERVIRDARLGEYSQSDVRSVSKSRLQRFFVKTGDRYRVIKELREMCLFAPHNILRDPPFSRMDFISCCNLLIYFDSAAQKKALATLNFALGEGGFLMLGKSETIGTSSQFFTQVNNRFKIYSRKKGVSRKVPELAPSFPRNAAPAKKLKLLSRRNVVIDSKELDATIDSILLTRYMPACAIINKEMDILQFRGSTALYLSHTSGKASLNILKMTRPEFTIELRNAIHKAFKTKLPVIKSGIEIKIDSIYRTMSLEVCPMKIEWDEPLLLIVFTLQGELERDVEYESDKGKRSLAIKQKDKRIARLTDELRNMRGEMHAVIGLQEAAYEQLQAANEEIVSTNEEFQTLNEELETSKEEIEASNEELISTNQELQMRNDLLTESYRYSEAIIATVHEPMIILDSNLMVKSANKSFYRKFNVGKEETEGVYLFDLGNKQWDIPKLRDLLNDILSKKIDFKNLEITHVFPVIGEKVMLLNAHRIVQKTHREQLILLAIEDITERARHYQKEKEELHKDIMAHKEDKLELEKAVRRRTRQLQHKNLELENANKELTSFTYVSSHDLQEPLRKIQNFTTLLLMDEQKRLSGDGKKYLKRTFEVAKRMQTLIEDLLAYSRVKNGEQVIEEADMNKLFEEVKHEFAELIKSKKAIIQAEKLCKVKIIPFQFRQLLQNLISNSLKFVKPGRKPRIRMKSRIVAGNKLADLKLSSKLSYCHITFADNGIGFDPKYSERIFEVFQRLHSQEEYKGTGMGLAICKRIVENHRGIITATGQLGKGAKFDIYIPAE